MRESHGNFPQNPRQGEALLRWAALPKSEAAIVICGCGPRSRACDDNARFRPFPGRGASRSGAPQTRDPRRTPWLKGFGDVVMGPGSAVHREERCTASGTRAGLHNGVMVSFTAATNWLSVKGLGRNANC